MSRQALLIVDHPHFSEHERELMKVKAQTSSTIELLEEKVLTAQREWALKVATLRREQQEELTEIHLRSARKEQEAEEKRLKALPQLLQQKIEDERNKLQREHISSIPK